MKKIFISLCMCCLLLISQSAPVSALFENENITLYENEVFAKNSDGVFAENESKKIGNSIIKVPIKVLGLTVGSKTVTVKKDKTVYLGGQTVGIALYTDGLLVTQTASVEDANNNYVSPGSDAGIKKGDYILSADGVKLTDRTTLDTILKNSKSKKIKLEILRGQSKSFTEISPVKTKDGYKLGLYLRDSAAGLGTVTCVDPETNEFYALGHGINDFDTGKILTLRSGRLVTCIISGAQKGEKGRAGELKGTFGVNARQLGVIKGNTRFGLYGTVYKGFEQGEAILVGSKENVHVGKAEMYSDFEGTMKKYSIEIQHVNNQTLPEEKSMIIKITDPHLIETTGGIVQGLSGSPIVQDGKLIGAVTHVMLSDATRGYGIFIENMLDTAQSVAESNKLKEAS